MDATLCTKFHRMRVRARATAFAPFGDPPPEREAELRLATWL